MSDNAEFDDYWRGYIKREREQEMAKIQETEIKIKKMNFKPGDVVVITAPGVVSFEMAKRLQRSFEENFPGVKALIFGDGLEVEIQRCTNSSP